MHVRPGQQGDVSILIVIVVVVLALVFGGYKLIGWAADQLAARVPDKLEADLFGGLGARQAGWKKAPATDAQKRAGAIFAKLAKAKGLRALDYELYFMPEAAPNAFALPGGTIGVTEGLLKLVEGDVGLAMVLGHEFGHQQHRHSLRMMGRSLLLAGVMLFVVGDAGFLVSAALDLAQKSHSREQELEADDYGLKMVHKIFKKTDGALEFFEKLEKDQATKDAKVLSMLSTHPYTPDRIERLKALQKQLDKR